MRHRPSCSSTWRDISRVAWSAAAALVMTACGSQIAPMSPGASSGSASTSASTPTTSAPQPSVFPVTITRRGGIAGFQDVMVVAGDGLVWVTSKGQPQRQCRLTAVAVKRMTMATDQVPWPRITPASTEPAIPDDLVTMVQSPAGGPVRLDDPQVGEGGPVFEELVNELTGGRTASRMSRPV